MRFWTVFVGMLLLAGCAEHLRTSAARSPSTVVLVGKLSADVRPLAYTLELEIVPRRDRFSGRTQIRVQIAKPIARLRIHGARLHMRHARAVVGNSSIEARYSEIGEGVARVEFQDVLPVGEAVADFV